MSNSVISQTYNFPLNEEQKEKVDLFLSYKPEFIKKNFSNIDKALDSQYIYNVKAYFKRIQKNKYVVNDKYSFSDCGRMFSSSIEPDGRSIQGLSNEIRSYLLNGFAVDIDMKNASFNFVKYIINTNFSNKKDDFKILFDYAKNRELYFRNGFNKMKYIEILFGRNITPKNFNTFDNDIQLLIKEIIKFKKLIEDNLQIFSHINFKENSHIGSQMSYIIFTLENQLLQKVLSQYKNITLSPVFDGVILKKDINIKNTLNHINELGKEYDITFINKEFPLIQIDEKPPDYNLEYKKMKEEFEKNHFIIEDPLQYVRTYKNNLGLQISYYNKRDFVDVVAPFQIEDKPFFNEWIKDPERLSYKKVEWFPNLEKANVENYNTFTGFKTEKLETTDFNKVSKFLEHLKLLTNYEEKATDYLIKYVAHMFQKPEELPQTALLFKSYQGVGKDIFIDILGACIGKDLIHKDAKMDNIVGTFNKSLLNKLIIQLNEVQGKDGHFNKELLKDLITTNDINLRKMRTDTEKFRNFMRLFLFTNNLNPIDIPSDDRRYLVFQTSKPKDKQYYKELSEILNDKDALNNIYTYFMEYDISNFTPHIDRVETKAYKNIKKHNSNPFYEFLYEMINEPEKHKIINKSDNNYIITKYLEHFYSKFLNSNYPHITSNSKTNKAVLLDLGAEDKKFYINKKQVRGYQINLTELKETLKKYHNIDDEEEIIDLDLDIDDSFLDETDDEE